MRSVRLHRKFSRVPLHSRHRAFRPHHSLFTPCASLSQAELSFRTRCLSVSSSTSAVGTLKFSVEDEVAQLGKEGPLAMYERLVGMGTLTGDPEQQRVIEILNVVYHGVHGRQTKGLYLYGSVGCGKTMLMDIFFTAIAAEPLRVERKHFHDFLNELQVQLHRKKLDGSAIAGNVVEQIAHDVADRLDVLCFDEFAITTIQDCVLLMPLFSVLFQRGVVVVMTSNRAPEDIYTDGLNRHHYLPQFLNLLRAHCKIHHQQCVTDYRTVQHENSPDAGVYCWPPDRSFIDRWFQDIVGSCGSKGVLNVSFGRTIAVSKLSSCSRIARWSFDDLCGQFLSADDYMWLCRHVHTILLDDVPRLTVDNHNEARRFTTLIDHCYEHHVRLICSMDGSPEELLGGLSELQDIGMKVLGKAPAGCGDGDTSSSSSGVLQAINRIKDSMAERAASGSVEPALSRLDMDSTEDVLSSEVARVRRHGDVDVDVWRQGDIGQGVSSASGPLQVSRAWDDRRRISNFTWESSDPTSEQQTIRGVFAAAVASLQETGFAVDRAISRLKEMQTVAFQDHHRLKHF